MPQNNTVNINFLTLLLLDTIKQLPVLTGFSIETGFFWSVVFRAEKYVKYDML